jgi:hypothetical protein
VGDEPLRVLAPQPEHLRLLAGVQLLLRPSLDQVLGWTWIGTVALGKVRAVQCSAARGDTMLVGKALNGVAAIPEQMPSIDDLYGGGCTLPDPVGISASAITGDDLDARATAQPGCDRL